MREIKFRVWFAGKHWYGIPAIHYRDGKISRIDLNHDDSDFDPTPDTWTGPDDFVLEQFTGLHDRNGKEIYEGDMLAIDSEEYGVVVYSDGAYHLEIPNNHQGRNVLLQERTKKLEVSGTIHDKGEAEV